MAEVIKNQLDINTAFNEAFKKQRNRGQKPVNNISWLEETYK